MSLVGVLAARHQLPDLTDHPHAMLVSRSGLGLIPAFCARDRSAWDRIRMDGYPRELTNYATREQDLAHLVVHQSGIYIYELCSW